jgi:hypothetical protein
MFCKECDSLKIENYELMLCSKCNRLRRKIDSVKTPEDPKPIKKVSDVMAAMLSKYAVKKKRWIKGKVCAVLKNVPATDVHHSAGRGIDSYYDEWAEERGICLLLDERFWIPVSREGHTEIEKRPDWAKIMGFSEDRLVNRKID